MCISNNITVTDMVLVREPPSMPYGYLYWYLQQDIQLLLTNRATRLEVSQLSQVHQT